MDLCGGATGQVETTQVRGGPGPGRRSRLLNTLNEILVFDLSLAIWSIRTNHLRGDSYGHSTSWYQPKLIRRQRLSGARRVGLCKHLPC